MLHINDLTFRYGGRVLFDQATVHVAQGQKVGLVGRNGAGKSTLFRLIRGDLAADGGGITLRPRHRMGWLAQETPEGEDSLLDFVLAADEERQSLLAELDDPALDPHRLADVHERLNAIEAHTAPARAAIILAGLGFNAEAQARPVSSFSGGWRMRLALAAALFARPDLLLLDEPTNHLDLEATLWLQGFLAGWQGTLIVISHDREILNAVCNRIVHLDGHKLVAYGGNYDAFTRTRAMKMDLAAKAQSKQLEQRRKIQAFIDRFRAKATKARQAQSRVKMLERMEPVVAMVEERTITFEFPDPDPLSPPIIALNDGVAGYGDTVVLRNLNLRVDMDDRIALLGANGNGKSTLAKVLALRLPLLAGKMTRSPKLKVGYFAQHQTDELAMGKTPYDHMGELMPDAPEAKIRAQLGRFGFEQDRANVTVANLSGGEKARLLFALMSYHAPHLMILDEPTNHLDIDSRESLMAALNAYEGAVILVSHDPHLIEATADRLWLVADGRVSAFDGDLDDYRRWLTEQAREAEGRPTKTAAPSRKDDRRSKAEARAQTAPLRKAVQTAEKRLDELHKKKTALSEALADPALYSGPQDKVLDLQKQAAAVDKAMADAEEDWLNAQMVLDMAEAGAA